LCLVLAVPAVAQVETPRVFVLDPDGLSLTALSLDTAAVVGKATLQGAPGYALINPERNRVVVLDKGPGKMTICCGYKASGKSFATVVDAHTLAVVSRTELGFNVDLRKSAAVFSQGRVTLALAGYRSGKPEEALPRELVSLDLATGQVAARFAIEGAIDDFVGLPDGKTALAFAGRETPKNQPPIDAAVHFVDLESLKLVKTVTLKGDPGIPVVSPDGQFAYLLEVGKPDKKPEKNINGRVQVVSLATREHVTNLDAGRDPRGLVLDKEGNQVFVLAEGEPGMDKNEVPGVLRVIRGAEEVAKVPVGEEPLFLRVSPNRERLVVVSEKTLTHVDLPSLSRLGKSVLKPAGISLMTDGGGKSTVKELAITRDGKRGYALYAASSKLGVLDLESNQLVASITTGRGGVKFGKFLGAVALTAASYAGASSAAAGSGGGVFFYQVHTVAPANTSLATTLDEKFVYVLNTNSNDVTVIDSGTKTVVTKIGVGGNANRLEMLPGGAFVAVNTGADTLHLIDTKTNAKVSELPDGGNFLLAPGDRFAAAIGKGVVYCMDGGSLKVLGKAAGFKRPSQLLFEPEPVPVTAGSIVSR
jgi:YVTN family beta-propeller protein